MYKKIGIVTALSAALLFGGASHHSVDAAAYDQHHSQSYKFYYSVGNHSQDQFNTFLNRYFNSYSLKWNHNNWNSAKNQHKNPANTQQNIQQPEKQEKPVQQEEKPVQQVEKPVTKPQTPAQKPETEKPTQSTNQSTQAQSQQLSQFEQEVVELTNQERAKQGLAPLKIDVELSKVAHEKSRDMAANNYFSHTSPTYGSPFNMMKQYGITYRSAGENIARGQRTPAEVVNAWMNSEGHRANILSSKYTHIGVGYVEQGNNWTQEFIGK